MIVSLATLTFVHTALSLVAILAGLFVVADVFAGRYRRGWTSLFLVTAIATSVTGFAFPFTGILPSHVTGIVALIVLAAVLLAGYGFHYSGAWRWIYAVGMVISVYLLVFVGVVQAFLKIPALKSLAPTGSELPFVLAQGATLILFIGLSIGAARVFRAPTLRTAGT